jgi:hypothetical protein
MGDSLPSSISFLASIEGSQAPQGSSNFRSGFPIILNVLVLLFSSRIRQNTHLPVFPASRLRPEEIFLVAFFLTDRGSPRIPLLLSHIEQSSLPVGFRYYLVNWTSTNMTSPPSLAPSDYADDFVTIAMTIGGWRSNPKGAQLLAKFFFSLNFFLANTTANWFWRGTDDVIINFPLLRGVITELGEHRDPTREAIYAGNCINVERGPVRRPFLQGGSGYLMSRFGCQQLAGQSKVLMLHSDFEEDQSIGEVLGVTLGVNPRDMTSSHFLGYMFSEHQEVILTSGQYDMLPGCPEITDNIAYRGRCRQFLRPLNEVVFFHQSRKEFRAATLELAQAVFASPTRVKWWVSGYKAEICVKPEAFG